MLGGSGRLCFLQLFYACCDAFMLGDVCVQG